MTDHVLQNQIRHELEVIDPATFDAKHEAERRINFLVEYLHQTGCAGYVLGISGGVDSTTGGRLAQLACERVRDAGRNATFVAMRLPYGTQKDESDAQAAVAFIQPDELLTVNIKPAVDGMWAELDSAGLVIPDGINADFVKGNVKARERMIAQFTVAGARRMLVIGTDQAAEALVGFYTKFGDGAADLTPLTGLSKRRVKAIARVLGMPEQLVEKTPTADLEDNKPLIADEIALGVSYVDVDDYLEGKAVSAEAEKTILGWYRRTAHKRALPVTPGAWEARKV